MSKWRWHNLVGHHSPQWLGVAAQSPPTAANDYPRGVGGQRGEAMVLRLRV